MGMWFVLVFIHSVMVVYIVSLRIRRFGFFFVI